MKTLLTLILVLTLNLNLTAAQMQIHAHHDSAGVIDFYETHTWNGPDGSMVVTKYTIAEAQTAFGKLLDSTEAGVSKTPDRVYVDFDKKTGEVNSITSQVIAVNKNQVKTGQLETITKTSEEITPEVKTDAANAKEDVEVKTGKTIDGKDK